MVRVAKSQISDRIAPRRAAWISEQPMFFVATAPLAGDGMVNVSPKGMRGTFLVLDEHTFAYVDMTASGIETTAHLRENGRICVMFCSFDSRPTTLRLHGRGRVVTRGENGFDAALEPFAEGLAQRRTEARGVITVDVARVADSCGFSLPQMTLKSERGMLDVWSNHLGSGGLKQCRVENNQYSLDGLPGLAGLPDW